MDCERCGNEVVYPHYVPTEGKVCDDCYEDLCYEHARECDAQELERELRQTEEE